MNAMTEPLLFKQVLAGEERARVLSIIHAGLEARPTLS